MIDILQIMLGESFWAASLRIATPLIFGVLGALLCERAGVLNLGIEGIFVVGAMTGYAIARFRFRANDAVMLFFMATLAFPIPMIMRAPRPSARDASWRADRRGRDPA